MQATPHSPDTGTTSFLQISSQNVTIPFKCAGRMRLVMSVLYLYSYKNVPGRQKCSRQKCTQSPLLLCGTISFIPMRGANVCWKVSANAVPTLPRARALTCPASRLWRKMLPELGIEADHLSKAGLKELNNEQRIKPSLHLSFHLSSATPSSPHQFLFCRALLSDGKRTNSLSHLRRRLKKC